MGWLARVVWSAAGFKNESAPQGSMERFEVKRGLVKQVTAEGGLAALASRHFEVVEADEENSFSGSHDIMTSIVGHYSDKGALIVDVTNVPPNFDDPDAMARAQDTRKRWTTFLDESTGYNSKQRGDKAKEWAKKAAKAKSAVSSARHFMEMSDSVPADKIEKAESLIEEIESLLKENENTKAKGRAEKLNKLFN